MDEVGSFSASFEVEILYNQLALKISDLDAGLGSCTKPVVIRGDAEGVDNGASFEVV